MSQLNFNMMDAAGYGFYRVWIERSYLLKLAAIPLLIKFACIVTILVLELDGNVLRQGLILFPSILAEGWVLAQFLRTLLKNERWPTILPADIDDTILDKLLLRARGIVAATLAFTLISLAGYMLIYLIIGLVFGNFQITNQEILDMVKAAQSDPEHKLNGNPLMIFPLMMIAVGMLWGVRLVWIYIPLSVLMPVKDYLKAIGGVMASVKMLVLYFCTMTPIMFVRSMVDSVVYSAAATSDTDVMASFIMIFVNGIAITLVGLVSTAAFVWAMKDILPKNPDLLKEIPKIGGEK